MCEVNKSENLQVIPAMLKGDALDFFAEIVIDEKLTKLLSSPSAPGIIEMMKRPEFLRNGRN